jgi:hypothetical protein
MPFRRLAVAEHLRAADRQVAPVLAGEPLEISGTTNRESGTTVVIYTIAGPTYLPAAVTEVVWPTPDQGIFTATIDTTHALPGNYTLRADDGDGNTDTVTVELVAPSLSLDTGAGTYPSISGTHNGTITMTHTVNVSTIYLYPCAGTGGHIEYARIWNASWDGAEAQWMGYVEDWQNLSFDHNFTLVAGETYNYTIRTGSYPQIIHEPSYNATGGTITCTEFVDANGKRHKGGYRR